MSIINLEEESVIVVGLDYVMISKSSLQSKVVLVVDEDIYDNNYSVLLQESGEVVTINPEWHSFYRVVLPYDVAKVVESLLSVYSESPTSRYLNTEDSLVESMALGVIESLDNTVKYDVDYEVPESIIKSITLGNVLVDYKYETNVLMESLKSYDTIYSAMASLIRQDRYKRLPSELREELMEYVVQTVPSYSENSTDHFSVGLYEDLKLTRVQVGTMRSTMITIMEELGASEVDAIPKTIGTTLPRNISCVVPTKVGDIKISMIRKIGMDFQYSWNARNILDGSTYKGNGFSSLVKTITSLSPK